MKFNMSDLLLLLIVILLVKIIGYKEWEFWAMLIMIGLFGLRNYYEGLHFNDVPDVTPKGGKDGNK